MNIIFYVSGSNCSGAYENVSSLHYILMEMSVKDTVSILYKETLMTLQKNPD